MLYFRGKIIHVREAETKQKYNGTPIRQIKSLPIQLFFQRFFWGHRPKHGFKRKSIEIQVLER